MKQAPMKCKRKNEYDGDLFSCEEPVYMAEICKKHCVLHIGELSTRAHSLHVQHLATLKELHEFMEDYMNNSAEDKKKKE